MSNQMNQLFPIGRRYKNTNASIGLVFLKHVEYMKFLIKNAKFYIHDLSYLKEIRVLDQLPFHGGITMDAIQEDAFDLYFFGYEKYTFEDLKYTGVIDANFTEEELKINESNYIERFHSSYENYIDIVESKRLHHVHFLSGDSVRILWKDNINNKKKLNATFFDYRIDERLKKIFLILDVDNTNGIMVTYPHIKNCKLVFEDFSLFFLKEKLPHLSTENLLIILRKYLSDKKWLVYVEEGRMVCKITEDNITIKESKDISEDLLNLLDESTKILNNGFIFPYNLNGYHNVTLGIGKDGKHIASYNNRYVGILDNGSYTIIEGNFIDSIRKKSKPSNNTHPLLMNFQAVTSKIKFKQGVGIMAM